MAATPPAAAPPAPRDASRDAPRARYAVLGAGEAWWAAARAAGSSRARSSAAETARACSSGEAAAALQLRSDGSEGLSCSVCGVASFSDVGEQRLHFRSDWHRLNARRRAAGRPAVRLERFEALCAQAEAGGGDLSDVSSISGSEDEEEGQRALGAVAEEGEASGAQRSDALRGAKVLFEVDGAPEGRRAAVWRSLLCRAGEAPSDEQLEVALREVAPAEGKLWAVVLAAGGHVAAAVFERKADGPPVAVAHKTFHRYVVRAKAGGRQSTEDNSGRAPKSAGSSLRRHNEAMLNKETTALLDAWADTHLARAERIFVHAPGAAAKAVFASRAMRRDDTRIRSVPFTTRRPTFSEARRVAAQLAAVEFVDAAAADGDPLADATGAAKAARVEEQRRRQAEQALAEARHQEWLAAERDAAEAMRPPPLHEAALAGDAATVAALLAQGADPAEADQQGRVACALAISRGKREVVTTFRRARGEEPQRWDWEAAKVPAPLTAELEDKQEAKRKAKADKLKAKIAAKQEKRDAARREREAKERKAAPPPAGGSNTAVRTLGTAAAIGTAALVARKMASGRAANAASDRELRARAAEVRLAAMGIGAGPAELVCANCGTAIDSTPFERLNRKYCSTVCVAAHRRKLEA